MRMLRFFVKSTAYTCGKLCRQIFLLAGLALLCLFLPSLLGSGASQMLSQGVEFSGIRLAVTAPEGDPIPELLEQYMVKMRDISRYCSFHAMDKETAVEALARGEVEAVLELPEDFVDGILYGTNPDVNVIVDGERPLEALLTLWVGQSAADLLGAVQSGVYEVLDAYDLAPVEGLDKDDVVMGINLCYIDWTLNRQNIFKVQTLKATGTLPVELHYSLSLSVWLCLSLAPLFFPVYETRRLQARKRLYSLGLGSGSSWLSDLAACTVIMLPVCLLSSVTAFGSNWTGLVVYSGIMALLCGLFGSLCCLLTGSAARCGGLAFLVPLLGLFVSGGILPPVMLPQSVRKLEVLSPVTWLRSLAAGSLGYEQESYGLYVAVAAVGMAVAGWLLYRRRMQGQEVAQ